MELARYLTRIGVTGRPEPTPAWLARLHRAHLEAIPYENLDVALGRPVSIEPVAAYRKLVEGGRGGWCYEMNGLLAWALRESGFAVDLLAATVRRRLADQTVSGNHLALLVHLDRPYLADVGFGDGLMEPIPLEAGIFRQGAFEFGLESVDGRWIFHNQADTGAPSFDFTTTPVEAGWFATPSTILQTSDDSPFRRGTVCQRLVAGRYLTLRGALLRTTGSAETKVIESAGEYADSLERHFGIRDPMLESLWPVVWDRHLEWLARERP